MGLFASRDIIAGEELTYDYNFHNFGGERQICLCGARNCRGWMGKSTEYRQDDLDRSTNNASSVKQTKKKLPSVGDKRKAFDWKPFQRHRSSYLSARIFLLRNLYWLIPRNSNRNKKKPLQSILDELNNSA